MHHNEFAYWLQGYFELRQSADSQAFDEEQIKIITQHLDLVRKVEGTNNEFEGWLRGVLDCYFLSGGHGVLKFQTLIQKRLGELFQHEIDTQYENREELQKIHDGETSLFKPLTEKELKKAKKEAEKKMEEWSEKNRKKAAFAIPPGMPAMPRSDVRYMC